MNHAIRLLTATLGLAFALALGRPPATVTPADRMVLAQAMVPPSGMNDAQHPMPMKERYLRRFPQPVRVGDLIGLPILDHNASTLGYVRQVVRTPEGEIELIVSYSRWWGWFGRAIAVPIEVVGIEGRHLVSLDMPPSAYAAAPTYRGKGAAALPADATIRIALSRS
jgi:hypothetical protein